LIVGSAAKATDPEGKKTKADPYRMKVVHCWREKFVGSPKSCLRIRIFTFG